jgi:polyferredoxin
MSPAMVAPPPAKPRKKLHRRLSADRSQRVRRCFQFIFLALNVWIAGQFVLFVRFYESGGRTFYAQRPPGVEGWLPIASLMNLKVWLATGEITRLHPAGLFLLLSFLAICWTFRKAFCSWLCPIGTLSEYLYKLGGPKLRLPRWLDIPVRGLKYLLFGLFLYAVGSMSVGAIKAFLEGPYGVVADVKMLNFFRYLGVGGLATLAALVALSIFIRNFWCRYLCPYGAFFGLVSLLSPMRIRREPAVCIDCAKCTRACPSLLPVDKLVTIQSAECTGCLECVAVCPAEGALHLSLPQRRSRVPLWAVAAGIALLFVGTCAWAQWTGHWHTDFPSQVYFDLIPRAREFTHP